LELNVQFFLLIKSQFATNVQNVLNQNQCTQRHLWS